jgi:hypothetical protein
MDVIEIAGALAGAGLILASFLIPLGGGKDPRFLWPLFGAGYLAGAAALARIQRRIRAIRLGAS